MIITTKDTQVIVFFGDAAIPHFLEMIRCWSHMLSTGQWGVFHFFLIGSQRPTLKIEDQTAALINDSNTSFFSYESSVPDSVEYHDAIFDKVQTGNVILHVICDSGNQEIPYSWMKSFVQSAVSVEALTTTVMYYLFFGRKSEESVRTGMIDLLEAQPGAAFLLGDMNDSGGRVTTEDRWRAAELAVLLNSAGALPVREGAFSLGYSALNANGSELKRLNESAACRALREGLRQKIRSMAEAQLQMQLLPEGLANLEGLQGWIRQQIEEHIPKIGGVALKNAWITIRMNPELPPLEAVQRLRRFADLNYSGEFKVGKDARELAWKVEQSVRKEMQENVGTASLDDEVLNSIVQKLHQMATTEVEPAGCTYPAKPFLKRLFHNDSEEYGNQCKSVVLRSIQEYIIQKNINLYAAYLEKAYMDLVAWVHAVQGESDTGTRRTTVSDLLQDIQKELDSGDAGDAARLSQKYRTYSRELEELHPRLQELTEGFSDTFFLENGELVEQAWRKLVEHAGRNMGKKMPAAFRGDFFRTLDSEFSTQEERERFFDEYLSSGARMYRNLSAQQSTGEAVLLADDRLMDQWFTGRNIFEVKTDNAENVTVYPLGNRPASEYLKEKGAYFMGKGTANGSGKDSLFEGYTSQPGRGIMGSRQRSGSLFASEAPAEEELPDTGKTDEEIRLEPDAKNEYRLYWKWHGNDQTAMVEMSQYGERVGRVAVIPVQRYMDSGRNMNVTADIMQGKPVPAGTITVTIRDDRQNVYLSMDVPGRRDVVRYKVNSRQLQLRPETRTAVERLVLRTTDTDGTNFYYPLYASSGEKPWLYEGLNLSDGKLVEDPTQKTNQIFVISM